MSDQELRIAMFGGLRLHFHGRDLVPDLPTKAQALLCYLVLNRQTHTRQELSGRFWGESTEKKAQVSLRVALRKVNERGLEPYLIAKRFTLAFNAQVPYWCDVEAFEAQLKQSRFLDGRAKTETLRRAVDLCQGSFLQGFDAAADAHEFEEWMIGQRARLWQLATTALDSLVDYYLDAGEYELGIEYASRHIELEPLQESAHRQLMRLLALSGKRTAALLQYEKLKELLLLELNLAPDIETQLLYKEIQGMRETQTTPSLPLPPVPKVAPDLDLPPFQAPPRDPLFVGRANLLARLEAALTSATEESKTAPSKYCLVGMGGVGKTTLAIDLAYRLKSYFPDGVLWATAVSQDTQQIAETWANAYGYNFSGLPTEAEQTAALRRLLAQKQALLVADDVTVAAAVRPLLPKSGRCVILLTSRNQQMADVLAAQPLVLNELSDENGRALLEKHIGSERAAREPEALTAICGLLQNLPLALAIAGGYLAARPYRQLASFREQLQLETERLELSVSDQEVRATLALSWAALDAPRQQMFARLAVFGGRSFSAEAAAAVAEISRYHAQDLLHDLVRLSLLTPTVEDRYQQHALLADFAGEKLTAAPAAYQRLVAYFLAYAKRNQSSYSALRREWENLNAANQAAHDHHLWPEVLAFSRTLQPPRFANGRYDDARLAFAWAEAAAMELEDEPALAATWRHWGRAYLEQGRYQGARQYLEKSLALYREMTDEPGVAQVLFNLARADIEQSQLETAAERLRESRELYEALADARGLALVKYRQARLLHRRDNDTRAHVLAVEARDELAQEGDFVAVAQVLRLLTFVVLNLNKVDQAQNYADEALRLAQEVEDLNEIAMAHYGLMSVYKCKNQLEKAEEMAEKGLKLLERTGDQQSQAMILFEYCQVKKLAADYEAAIKLGKKALAILRQVQDMTAVAFVLTHLGDCHDCLGRSDEAREKWREACDIAQTLNHENLLDHLRQRLEHGFC